jgi:GNAT superfamily N-acetyltransferase
MPRIHRDERRTLKPRRTRSAGREPEEAGTLRCEELRPEHWAALKQLFGPNGACGGCWCMWWRVPQGGKLWKEMQGENARRAFRALVIAGKARGILAFDGQTPVGWCAFGPRTDFPRTERSRAYQREDLEGVWSINCFFVHRAHRGRGVAKALLAAATEACRRSGARIIEAYPAPPQKDLRGAFWRGPLSMFVKQGYSVVKRETPARPVVEAPAR